MDTYQKYKISGLDQSVIRQSDILPLIEGLRQKPLFNRKLADWQSPAKLFDERHKTASRWSD
ncbi:hypothetical protein GCM10008940_22190 [Microbulbifer agarilyticus]